MMISTKGRYALRIMIDLAQHMDDGYISLKKISDRQEISIKYLESIISKLNKSGLVKSLRGKEGGYRLTKNPEEYTVALILKTTELSIAPVACVDDEINSCSRVSNCLTFPMWSNLDKIINEYLESITLIDLINQNIE
jgi:Rrf2 family protein